MIEDNPFAVGDEQHNYRARQQASKVVERASDLSGPQSAAQTQQRGSLVPGDRGAEDGKGGLGKNIPRRNFTDPGWWRVVFRRLNCACSS